MPNPFDQSGDNQPQNQFEDKTPAEFMEDLVGEGKKYATAEEAVRALAHANNHISKLEGENATQRTQLEKAATVEDIMSKLQQQPNATQEQNTGDSDQSQQPSQEPVDVEALVSKMLKEQQSTQTAQVNRQSVVDAMQKQFGGKAGEIWDAAEKNLGVNLEDLCATSPQAAMKLLGVDSKAAPADVGGSFQSDAQPQPEGQRPPEGSKRLVDYLLAKGDITRADAYKLKLTYSADPAKYNS